MSGVIAIGVHSCQNKVIKSFTSFYVGTCTKVTSAIGARSIEIIAGFKSCKDFPHFKCFLCEYNRKEDPNNFGTRPETTD
ncbi:unnamed protein product [Clavelina lepadiformis]|uniref:Uncharacterized protein n=1 Tax=Clavelina lepadiformis TaxID=159417 RepID=A0ABP0FQY4_CLALP